jgi:hypothetical protein
VLFFAEFVNLADRTVHAAHLPDKETETDEEAKDDADD